MIFLPGKRILPSIIIAFAVANTTMVSGDTLSDIYELALKNDPRLKAAEATYRANIETEKQALAAFLPQISATATYTDRESDRATASSFEPSITDSENEGYSATLTQNIFDLSAWFTFQQGKAISEQAEAQLVDSQQIVIVRISESYFNVLRAIDNLEASKAEERATKRQLEQTQQRFDVGLIAITDVHEAQASYDSTVVQRLTDEGDLGTAYESLSVATGQIHDNLWMLNETFPIVNPDPVSRNEWVDYALKNNYSLKVAIHNMEAARQNASSKKMGHAPTITGRVQYDNSDSDDENPFLSAESESTTWSVSFNLPVFSGGRVSSQRRQAHEQYNSALENKVERQRTVVQDTRALHIAVRTDVQRVKARQQAIVSTRSALEATQAGYEVGTRNIVDVLNAQRSLYASLRDYSNSRYDYVINMLKLKQAAGMLSPQDIYDISKWLTPPEAPSASNYKNYIEDANS